jgi:hypothetical protein
VLGFPGSSVDFQGLPSNLHQVNKTIVAKLPLKSKIQANQHKLSR